MIRGADHPLRGYLGNLFGAEPNRKMTKAPPFLSLPKPRAGANLKTIYFQTHHEINFENEIRLYLLCG